jgi:hypothetical protein
MPKASRVHDYAVDPLKSDNHRAALTALRDILADSIRTADPNVVPQVAARLQAVLSEIAALPPVDDRPDLVSDLQAARAKRRAS